MRGNMKYGLGLGVGLQWASDTICSISHVHWPEPPTLYGEIRLLTH